MYTLTQTVGIRNQGQLLVLLLGGFLKDYNFFKLVM